MKFLVMHKHDPNTEAGKIPPPEFVGAMGALVGGLAQSGKLLDGEGLGASKTRSRVTFQGGERTVLHGPFQGSNELPAGFLKVSVRSRDEAIAAATRLGQALGGDLEIEVSKINEAWDLGFGEKPEGAPERYLIVHKATPASEAGQFAHLDDVVMQLKAEGVLEASAALTPSSQARRIQFRGGNRKVLDGPFAESKELIGGYVILDLASWEECLAFCTQFSGLILSIAEQLEIDIRPL